MVQYKQCRNLQNGMKTNNHLDKLQVIEQIKIDRRQKTVNY